MKLLRFRYILPVTVFMIVISMMIAYAKIMWDDDDSSIWYGPNNPPYTDPIASFTTDRDDFDSYNCPPPPPPPIVIPPIIPPIGGGLGGGPVPVPGPVTPPVVIVVPPYVPPVTGYQGDSFP